MCCITHKSFSILGCFCIGWGAEENLLGARESWRPDWGGPTCRCWGWDRQKTNKQKNSQQLCIFLTYSVTTLTFVSGEDFSDHEHDNLVDELEPAEHLGEPEQIFQDLHMSRISYEDLVKKSVVWTTQKIFLDNKVYELYSNSLLLIFLYVGSVSGELSEVRTGDSIVTKG